MADWNLLGNCHKSICYPTSGYWTEVSTGGSAHTKGNWTQVVAATPFDCWIILSVVESYIDNDYLFDIGVGGSGSESAIVQNLVWGSGSYRLCTAYSIPLKIPAGTRLSVRAQAESASQSIMFSVACLSTGGFIGFPLASVCTTYGANTADSGGTAITPSGTADTKGLWTEITNGLSGDISGFFFCLGDQGNYLRNNLKWAIDIGIGTADNEVAIVSDFIGMASTQSGGPECITPKVSSFFPIAIPSGSRISVRAACDGGSPSFDFILYTVR